MSIYNNNNNSPTDLNAVGQKGNGRGVGDACASTMSQPGIDCRMSILHAPWPPDRSKNDLKTQRDRNTSPDWPEHCRIPSIEHSPLEATESAISSLKRSLPGKFIATESNDKDAMGSQEDISAVEYQPASKCDPERPSDRIPSKFPRRSLSGTRFRYTGPKLANPASLTDSSEAVQGSGMTRHNYWGPSTPSKTHSTDDHSTPGSANKHHHQATGNNDRQGRATPGGQAFRSGTGSRTGAMGLGGGRKSAPVCRFYLESRCNKGSECPFSHDVQPVKRHELCKFYLNGFCVKHNHCNFMHGEFPCKFFHGPQKKCSNTSGNCRFSHDPITDPRVKEALEKVINESSCDDYDTATSGCDKSRLHPGDYRQQNPLETNNQGVSKPSLLGLPPQQLPNNDQQVRHGDNSAENRQAQGMGGVEKSMFFKDCLSRNRAGSESACDDKRELSDVTSTQSTSSNNTVTSSNIVTLSSTESSRKQIYTPPEQTETRNQPFPSSQQEGTHGGVHTNQSISENMRIPAMPCNVVPHPPRSSFPPFSNDHDQRICMSRFDPMLNSQMFPRYHWPSAAAVAMGCRPDQLNGPCPPFRHQQQRQQYNLMHHQQPSYHQRSFMHDADIMQCERASPATMLRGQDGPPIQQQLYRHPVAARALYPMALHHHRYPNSFQPPSSMHLPLMSPPESLLSASMQQGLAALSQPNQMSSAPMCPPMRRMQHMGGLGPMIGRVPHMHQTASQVPSGEYYPSNEPVVNQASEQYSLIASHVENCDDLRRFCSEKWMPTNAPANPQSQSINEAISKTLDHISAAMMSALPGTDDDVNYDDVNGGGDVNFNDDNDDVIPITDVIQDSDQAETLDEDDTFSESEHDADPKPVTVDKSAKSNFEALKVLVETIRTEVRKVKRARGDQTPSKTIGSLSRCTSESALYKQLRQLIISLRSSQRAADADEYTFGLLNSSHSCVFLRNESPGEPLPPPPTRIRGFTGPFRYRLHRIQLDQSSAHRPAATELTSKPSPLQDPRLTQCAEANLQPRDPRLHRPASENVRPATKESSPQQSTLQQSASTKRSSSEDGPAVSSRPKDPRLARLRSFELFKNNSGSEHG